MEAATISYVHRQMTTVKSTGSRVDSYKWKKCGTNGQIGSMTNDSSKPALQTWAIGEKGAGILPSSTGYRILEPCAHS